MPSLSTTTPPKVVALGGGHGLHATLSALRLLNEAGQVADITAVVTVADNGGSSGRLRQDFGVLPPGDLRMALAALCGTDAWGRTWADVFQHRFSGEGDLAGHALGNLVILGLWERLGSHVEALDWAGRLMGARGRVLPMATAPLDIMAAVRQPASGEVSEVRGQVQVATAPGEILHVTLDPAEPQACPEAIEAVEQADWVLLGPGSWYTSVLPHLMIPGMRQVLQSSSARRAVLLNLVPQDGETANFSAEDHLRVLHEHAPGLTFDRVLAHGNSVADPALLGSAVQWLGGQLLTEQLCAPGAAAHDHDLLAAALGRMFAT